MKRPSLATRFGPWGAPALPSPAALLGPGRPVTEATFALDIRSAGLKPFRFHVVGLLLHLLAAALVFVFTRSLLRRAGHARATPLAVLVAGGFALHPIQTEGVAHAAQRSEMLGQLYASTGPCAEACEAFRAARVRFGPARLPADFPERAADAGCGAR